MGRFGIDAGRACTTAGCCLAAFVLAAQWVGCRPPPPSGIVKGKLPKPYIDTRIGPGDVLEISVLGEAGLPRTYRVEPDGSIDFPYARRLKVVGLTPPEVARELAKRLSKGYYRNPQVYVFVKEYNSKRVTVFGAVKKAGIYGYKVNMDIVEAITMAGGFSDAADRNATTVTRIIDDRKYRIRVKVKDIGEGRIQNFILRPGDVVYVPRRFF